jgi:hypothetical protein
MHNILQGVSEAHEVISDEEKKTLVEWIEENANRYWLSPGGPLRPPEEGGADVIFVSISKKYPVTFAHKNRSMTLKCQD